MKKYEKEVLQAQLDREKEVLKRIDENYKDALAEINDKIAMLLGRSDAEQQHVIYQVEFQKSLKTQVQAILDTLHTNEFETVSEYLTKSYDEGFISTMYTLQKQNIPLVFPIDQAAVVAAIQEETKLSENLYTAMGKDITELRKRISSEISRGLSTGMMYGEIARNVASWARIPKNNAMRIARTESHRIQNKAISDAQFKAKEKGADVVKVWSAALDAKTRTSHRKLDGQMRELEDAFEVDGHKVMYPGGFGRPEEDINCRCRCNSKARWLLGEDFTKWTSDDDIAEIKAKDYADFKEEYYRKLDERKASERVREGAQKMNTEEQKPKNYTSEEVSQEMFKQYKKRFEEEGLEGKWTDAEGLREIDMLHFDIGSKMSANSAQRVQNKFVELLSKYKSGVANVSYEESLQGGLNNVSAMSRGLTYSMTNGTSTIRILDQTDDMLFRELANSTKSGYNIKGLKDEDYPVYYLTHEFGHSLVYMQGLKKDHVNYKKMKEFSGKIDALFQEYKAEVRQLAVDRNDLRKSTSKEFAQAMMTGNTEKMQEIQNKLNEFDVAMNRVKISDYAGTDSDEFLAESFALAELSTESSPYADKVMELVKEYFGW